MNTENTNRLADKPKPEITCPEWFETSKRIEEYVKGRPPRYPVQLTREVLPGLYETTLVWCSS